MPPSAPSCSTCFGYLTLRFQLSTYGVATNLDLFDEKYLFAGCRFLVYLVSSVPNILIILLVLAALGYVPYKLVPRSVKDRVKRWASEWCAAPIHLPLLGVILAVALIQFVLRKCFAFGNLLLRKQLPDEWLSDVLLTSDGKLALYFSGLVAGTLLTGAILLYVLRRGTATTAASKLLLGTLVFLFAVEFLLLPVNYGVLISTQQLPRVAEIRQRREACRRTRLAGCYGTVRKWSSTSFAIPMTSARLSPCPGRTSRSGSSLTMTYSACCLAEIMSSPAPVPGRRSMNRLMPSILLLTFLAGIACAQAQTNPTGAAATKPRTSTSFTEKLLKFFGISDSPGTLKGPGDEVTSGELWLADLDSRTTRALTSSYGYRSPIFLAGSKDVLALRGTDVVQLPSAGGEARKLYSVEGILKLVGSSSEDPGKVLILLRGEAGGRPRVGLLIVGTGAVAIVPYDPASSQDLQMLENLEGWSRTYGDRSISVKRQAKQALSGTVEWNDVFLKAGNQAPVDVSQCDGVNCGQPSLSQDGRLLVFVKARAE